MKQVYQLAERYLGLWEWRGNEHNPQILKWFSDVGHSWVKDDETAWCAAFVGGILAEAGLPHTGKLNARSYLDWGTPVNLYDASLGDVVVFTRGDPNGWQGHVAFFHSFSPDKRYVNVLGGNQANQVNIKPYATSRVLGVRRLKP